MSAGAAVLALLSLLVEGGNGADTKGGRSFVPPAPARGSGAEPPRGGNAETLRPPPSVPRFTPSGTDLLEQLRRAQSVAEKTRILEDIGYTRLQQAVPELDRIVSEETGIVRLSAIESLGRIGSTLAIDTLIGLTESSRSSVRYSSITALGRAGDEEGIAWLEKIADANLLGMGSEALEAIGLSGDERYIPYLAGMMERQPREIARGAAAALASIGTQRARHVLLRSARRQEPSAGRLAAIHALYTFDDPIVVNLLRRLIDDVHPHVARAAIESYARLGHEGAATELGNIALGGRRLIQEDATRGLELLGSTEAREELINILFAEDVQTQRTAASILARIGDDESLQALTDGLLGGKKLVNAILLALEKSPANDRLIQVVSSVLSRGQHSNRVLAGKVLIAHRGSAAIEPILDVMRRSKPWTREALCRLLATIEGKRAVNELLKIVDTGPSEIQIVALESLIENHRLPPDIAPNLIFERLVKARAGDAVERLAKLLATFDFQESNQRVVELLKSNSPETVGSVLKGIMAGGSPRLLETTVRFIQKLSRGARRQQLTLGLDFNRPESRAFLLDIASGDEPEAADVLRQFSKHAPHAVRSVAFEAIRNPKPEMRISGIHVLSQLQGTEEIHSTADLLSDPDPHVRHAAMTALGESTAPLATSRLLDEFEKGDDSTRRTVAYYLAESGHPRAFDLLVDAALLSTSEGGHFYDAIESIDSPQAKEALARLKGLAPNGHEELREAILNTELMQEERDDAFALYAFDDAIDLQCGRSTR